MLALFALLYAVGTAILLRGNVTVQHASIAQLWRANFAPKRADVDARAAPAPKPPPSAIHQRCERAYEVYVEEMRKIRRERLRPHLKRSVSSGTSSDLHEYFKAERIADDMRMEAKYWLLYDVRAYISGLRLRSDSEPNAAEYFMPAQAPVPPCDGDPLDLVMKETYRLIRVLEDGYKTLSDELAIMKAEIASIAISITPFSEDSEHGLLDDGHSETSYVDMDVEESFDIELDFTCGDAHSIPVFLQREKNALAAEMMSRVEAMLKMNARDFAAEYFAPEYGGPLDVEKRRAYEAMKAEEWKNMPPELPRSRDPRVTFAIDISHRVY